MPGSVTRIALTLAATAFASQAAYAGSFGLRDQSTIGLGQAFAGAAAGGAGLSSMYWNPATTTGFAGIQTDLSITGIIPDADLTPTTGTSPLLLRYGGTSSTGNIIEPAALPSGSASYQFNDRLFLGFTSNSPFGLSSANPTNWAGQIYARSSFTRSYDLSPNVAYAITDWLSIGAGLQAMYFHTKLTQALSPLPNAPSAVLKGGDWGFGYTLGATIKPTATTEIGVGYRSSVEENLEGSLQIGGPFGRLPSGTYPIAATVHLPDQVTVGVRQLVSPAVVLDAGFEWTNWSRLGTIPVTGRAGIINGATLTSLPFRYKDGYFASGGVEYAWSPKLLVRGGVGYEWSPIDISVRDPRVPDSDRVHTSIGMSYQWNERLMLNAAYSHIFAVGNGDVAIRPGNPHYVTGLPLYASVDASADTLSVGLSYKFGAPAAPVLVRKD